MQGGLAGDNGQRAPYERTEDLRFGNARPEEFAMTRRAARQRGFPTEGSLSRGMDVDIASIAPNVNLWSETASLPSLWHWTTVDKFGQQRTTALSSVNRYVP